LATDYIPDEHELIMSVAYGRLEKDENHRVVGILAEAFKLRPGEEYLSANWLDYFEYPIRYDRIVAAVRSARNSARPPTEKSGFALGSVSRIKSAAQGFGFKVRVIHEPVSGCEEHVALRQFPSDCEELLELLAAEHWSELVLNATIP
jgi:hypothetical protein